MNHKQFQLPELSLLVSSIICLPSISKGGTLGRWVKYHFIYWIYGYQNVSIDITKPGKQTVCKNIVCSLSNYLGYRWYFFAGLVSSIHNFWYPQIQYLKYFFLPSKGPPLEIEGKKKLELTKRLNLESWNFVWFIT